MLSVLVTLYLLASTEAFSLGHSATDSQVSFESLPNSEDKDHVNFWDAYDIVEIKPSKNIVSELSKYANSSSVLNPRNLDVSYTDVKCTATSDPSAGNVLTRIWRWFRPGYLYNTYTWTEWNMEIPRPHLWWSAWEPVSQCMVADGSGKGPNQDSYEFSWEFEQLPSTPDGFEVNWGAIRSYLLLHYSLTNVVDGNFECEVPLGEVAQVWAQCPMFAFDYKKRECKYDDGKITCERFTPLHRADVPFLIDGDSPRLGCSVGQSKVQCDI